MGGFDREKAIKEFNLPDDLQPVVFIALGYLDDPHKLTEPFKTREVTARHRKSLNEFVFEGRLT
jgi:nitroreductase